MRLAFKKLDIIQRAKQEEQQFSQWVDKKESRAEKYGTVLNDLADATEKGKAAKLAYTKAFESIYKIELTNIAAAAKRYADKEIDNGADTLKALQTALEKMGSTYKDYSASTDRKVAKTMLRWYQDNAGKEDCLEGLDSMNIDSFVDSIFDSSDFISEKALAKGIAEKGYRIFDTQTYKFAKETINKTYALFILSQKYDNDLAKARELYTEGLLEWKKGQPSYPDANFTMRLTYGTVKGYSPKDAVIYRHYTTLDGVMQKEDPTSWEFNVPVKLKELW
jgi:hypothetical protein